MSETTGINSANRNIDHANTQQNGIEVKVGVAWDGLQFQEFTHVSSEKVCKSLVMLILTTCVMGLFFIITFWAIRTSNEPVLKEVLFIMKVSLFSILAWAAGQSVIDSWKGKG